MYATIETKAEKYIIWTYVYELVRCNYMLNLLVIIGAALYVYKSL